MVTTIDGSLTVDGGLLVSVVGQLKVNMHYHMLDYSTIPFMTVIPFMALLMYFPLQTDNDPPHAFFQSFYLKQLGDSLFVFNDIFRLGLHHQ